MTFTVTAILKIHYNISDFTREIKYIVKDVKVACLKWDWYQLKKQMYEI